MSIPLVQNNEKDSINTSIIAIKKNLERINSILGLVDSGSDIDTSEFVKKSDIVDVVQSGNMNPVTSNAVATSNAMPVDTVTSGDMHSVTSNAVAEAITWSVKSTSGTQNVNIPQSWNGVYEVVVFDTKKHISYYGIRNREDVVIGAIATNYSGLNNDAIYLRETMISVFRESITNGWVVYARPVQIGTL